MYLLYVFNTFMGLVADGISTDGPDGTIAAVTCQTGGNRLLSRQ